MAGTFDPQQKGLYFNNPKIKSKLLCNLLQTDGFEPSSATPSKWFESQSVLNGPKKNFDRNISDSLKTGSESSG